MDHLLVCDNIADCLLVQEPILDGIAKEFVSLLQDLDMNLNELEDALQQINGQLMTDKEMQYVYHVS